MAHGKRLTWLAAGAATLLVTGLGAGRGVSPVSAAGAVSAVTGSAFGYHSFNISLFGGAQADVGPTPTVALATDASNSPQSATAASGVVQYGPATLLTTDAISIQTSGSIGATGGVTTTSSANNLNKSTTQPTITGSEELTADNLSGSCSASGSGTSGSTTITNGTLQTSSTPTTVSLPTNPPVDDTISGTVTVSASDTESFHYVFNEQTTDSSGNLTVNPVDEYFDGPTLKGNLIVGQVVCGVAPGTDLSVQNPGITHTPDPVAPTGTVTFTITVTNLGPAAAPAVLDTSMLMGGKFAGATSPGGTCAVGKGKNGGIMCHLGTIANGASTTVQVTATAPHKAGGTISISSTVSSPADINPANNTATDSVSVQ